MGVPLSPFPASSPSNDRGYSLAPSASSGVIGGRRVHALLFDLDGTLVETDDRAVAALARRLAWVAPLLPGRDPHRAARRLAMWSHDGLYTGLAWLDRLSLDAVVRRGLGRLRRAEAAASPRYVPVAGASDMLRHLSARYPIGIVSTRRAADVWAYLAQEDLEEAVTVVVGADTTRRLKPHPEPVLWAAASLGLKPSQVAMVGDTAADVASARAAGAVAVAVLCGFGEPHDFRQADLVLRTTAELERWLA
ncbi:MAG: HAD-IA family hydrolase [Anaerolineae bacterium]|nr:HAD-IA family hydrolase [Anaerolineae bacterium]